MDLVKIRLFVIEYLEEPTSGRITKWIDVGYAMVERDQVDGFLFKLSGGMKGVVDDS